MSNVIKKIELDLGKKTVTLTPEQAKKLKEALDELFGEKVVREEHHHHDHHRYWWHWDYPHWTYTTTTTPMYNTWTATNTGNTLTMKVA
jgi:hypothetical protein